MTVNSGGGQLDSYTVPGGSTNLAIWRVVNLTIDTAGNVSLTPVQSFTTGSHQRRSRSAGLAAGAHQEVAPGSPTPSWGVGLPS